MKTLLVYSTLTGNTRIIAQSVMDVLPEGSLIQSIKDNPSCEGNDLIIVCFWIDKGNADPDTKAFLQNIANKKVALFATLGAWPESDHARNCMIRAGMWLDSSNKMLGSFVCQGKIDPKLLKRMKNAQGAHSHGDSPESAKMIEEAKLHPDAADLANAQDTAKHIIALAQY